MKAVLEVYIIIELVEIGLKVSKMIAQHTYCIGRTLTSIKTVLWIGANILPTFAASKTVGRGTLLI